MIGVTELLIILLIILLLFGPTKLPELAKAIGKSVREYKKALSEDEEEKGYQQSKKRKKRI